MSKKSLLKVCALFAVFFFGAAQLPVMAATCPEQTQEETALRQRYAENTILGFVKGLELNGKQVTPEQKEKMRRIVFDAFPELIALVRKAGLYDEYKTQMLDGDIRELDKKILKAATMEEVVPLIQKEMALINERYPKLVQWLSSDPELQAFSARLMQKIAAVLQ